MTTITVHSCAFLEPEEPRVPTQPAAEIIVANALQVINWKVFSVNLNRSSQSLMLLVRFFNIITRELVNTSEIGGCEDCREVVVNFAWNRKGNRFSF